MYEIYLKEIGSHNCSRSEICGQIGRLETLAGGDNEVLRQNCLWFEKYNTIRMNYRMLSGNWQKLNVDFQMKIIYLLNYFSFKIIIAANFTRWLDNILYGLIPRMVEEIHLFQNVIIIIIIIFISSVLDAWNSTIRDSFFSINSLSFRKYSCTQQGPDVVLERVVKNFPSNEA